MAQRSVFMLVEELAEAMRVPLIKLQEELVVVDKAQMELQTILQVQAMLVLLILVEVEAEHVLQVQMVENQDLVVQEKS